MADSGVGACRVLPKLREENEREKARKKGQKGAGKRGIKDVVVGGRFFLYTSFTCSKCVSHVTALVRPEPRGATSAGGEM